MDQEINQLILKYQLKSNPIVYFSAEYGFDDHLPIYAGGLGILAADIFLEAAQQNLPFIAIGLKYNYGFDTYLSKEGRSQIDPGTVGFQLMLSRDQKPLLIDIKIGQDTIWLEIWFKKINEATIFLLDISKEHNSLENQTINNYLYDKDISIRLKQAIILGFGGVKLLSMLNISPSVFHLNEDQTALVPLALVSQKLKENPSGKSIDLLNSLKGKIVSSKHTILSGADLYFDKMALKNILISYFANPDDLMPILELGLETKTSSTFSVTKFLVSSSSKTGGVSKFHCDLENIKDPKLHLIPITNGINIRRWLSPNWPAADFNQLSDQEIWKIHQQNKTIMLGLLPKYNQTSFNPDVLTIVWARRLTGYKRPDLIFSDLKALIELIQNQYCPIRFIIAGRANSADTEAKMAIDKINAGIKNPLIATGVLYIADYNIALAKTLVAGADVWLNTPQFGKEACGTSGMKSALNGVLQCSIMDGWIAEVDLNNKGWVLPQQNSAQNLYSIIKNDIAPLYYQRDNKGLPTAWINWMRLTNHLILKQFSTKRVLLDYILNLYYS